MGNIGGGFDGGAGTRGSRLGNAGGGGGGFDGGAATVTRGTRMGHARGGGGGFDGGGNAGAGGFERGFVNAASSLCTSPCATAGPSSFGCPVWPRHGRHHHCPMGAVRGAVPPVPSWRGWDFPGLSDILTLGLWDSLILSYLYIYIYISIYIYICIVYI